MIESVERDGRPSARSPSTPARDSLSPVAGLPVKSFHASISPIVMWASAAEESSLPRAYADRVRTISHVPPGGRRW